jgi:hypothetical protein
MSAQNEGPECQQPYTFKTMEVPKPNYTIRFSNADNEEVGKMDFNGEGLAFEGNASESAIVFINWIDTVFRGRLEQEYKRGFEEGKKHETN